MNPWEARSALRYGSQHAGWFATEQDARDFAEKQIAAHGGVGRIGSVIDHCVYFDIYEEMS